LRFEVDAGVGAGEETGGAGVGVGVEVFVAVVGDEMVVEVWVDHHGGGNVGAACCYLLARFQFTHIGSHLDDSMFCQYKRTNTNSQRQSLI